MEKQLLQQNLHKNNLQVKMVLKCIRLFHFHFLTQRSESKTSHVRNHLHDNYLYNDHLFTLFSTLLNIYTTPSGLLIYGPLTI